MIPIIFLVFLAFAVACYFSDSVRDTVEANAKTVGVKILLGIVSIFCIAAILWLAFAIRNKIA